MRVASCVSVCLATAFVGLGAVSACSSTPATGGSSSDSGSSSSGSGNGSGSSSSSSSGGNSSSSSGAGSSSSSGGSSSGAGSSSSSSSSGAGSSSSSSSSGGASVDGGAPACVAGLQDKITTCTGTEPTCAKGCGPNLPISGNLGTKDCSCNTLTTPPTYLCAACQYPQPLPPCYAPPATGPVPACAAGVADKVPCTTTCDGNTTGALCTIGTDAGKTQGCVCVQLTSSAQWTCQTQWWP
jgi:hypothetical protein